MASFGSSIHRCCAHCSFATATGSKFDGDQQFPKFWPVKNPQITCSKEIKAHIATIDVFLFIWKRWWHCRYLSKFLGLGMWFEDYKFKWVFVEGILKKAMTIPYILLSMCLCFRIQVVIRKNNRKCAVLLFSKIVQICNCLWGDSNLGQKWNIRCQKGLCSPFVMIITFWYSLQFLVRDIWLLYKKCTKRFASMFVALTFLDLCIYILVLVPEVCSGQHFFWFIND